MLPSRIFSRFGGAFWALVVAWVCAQCPQAAFFVAGEWVRGAAHFSHQEKLVADVEAAISERGDVGASCAFAQAATENEPVKGPALPVGGLLEKLLLALNERERTAGDALPGEIFERAANWNSLLSRADEPRHPPPRGA